MREHFGDDAKGKRSAFYFLPFHFSFFTRYRPLPEAVFGPRSRALPLMSTRMELASAELGETADGLPPLERLLRCENEAAHGPIAEALWDAACDADAVAALERLAGGELRAWEEELRASGGRDERRDDRQSEG